MKFESKNPFLKNRSFTKTTVMSSEEIERQGVVIDLNDTMTVSGTINKTFVLLALLVAAASITWWMTYSGSMNPIPLTIGGAIIGLILVLVSAVKPHLSTYLAPGYAIFEGFFIGGLSAIFEAMYPGVVIPAVGATFATFLVCLGLYKFRIVKVTEQFKSIVIAATLAILTYYIISWVVSLFTDFIPVHSVHNTSLMSIGISVFVIIIAALNLFLDFDFIEKGAERQHPKYMEWFGAIGLMVTLVWLYVEFLRLIAKISSRD